MLLTGLGRGPPVAVRLSALSKVDRFVPGCELDRGEEGPRGGVCRRRRGECISTTCKCSAATLLVVLSRPACVSFILISDGWDLVPQPLGCGFEPGRGIGVVSVDASS